MGNPFARFDFSDSEFAQALHDAAEVDSVMNDEMEKMVHFARGMAPVDSGAYAAGIKVTRKARHGRGEIAATDYKSHWIEYGTSATEGHHATRAFGVMEKTAHTFGGTLGGGKGK